VFSAIDSVPMLQGIRSLQTEPWPAQMRNDLMWEAGLRSQTATLSWLHEQDTDWPYSFARVQTIERHFTGTVNSRQVRCWSVAAVQLALSRGSTWGHWSCEDVSGEEMFVWAHRNNCPCTCAADKAAAVAADKAAAEQAEEWASGQWSPIPRQVESRSSEL
jgi:hypothetical protein